MVLPEPAFGDIAPAGVVVGEASWTDTLGTHRLLLSETRNEGAADEGPGVALFAEHYVSDGQTPRRVQVVETMLEECLDGDLADQFFPSSLAVADADADGVGEATVVLTAGCVTDVVVDARVLMFTGEDRYEAIGARQNVGHLDDVDPDGESVPRLDPAPPGEVLSGVLVEAWRSDFRSAGAADGSAEDVDPALAAWVGDYTWTETVTSDGGSDWTWTHALTLSGDPGSRDQLAGTLGVTGHAADQLLIVQATLYPEAADGQPRLLVNFGETVTSRPSGPDPLYGVGEGLFIMVGPPTGPVTELFALRTLTYDLPTAGSYVTRVD